MVAKKKKENLSYCSVCTLSALLVQDAPMLQKMYYVKGSLTKINIGLDDEPGVVIRIDFQ